MNWRKIVREEIKREEKKIDVGKLRDLIERIERMEEEKKKIGEDIKEV